MKSIIYKKIEFNNEWRTIMQIVNIVATVKMEKPFNLEELLVKLPNVEKSHFGLKLEFHHIINILLFMVRVNF